MSKTVAAPEPQDDDGMMVSSPFIGGDPIVEEDQGTMVDLLEGNNEAGRFQPVVPAQDRKIDLNPAKHEAGPELSDAKDEAQKAEDGDEAQAEGKETDAEVTPEELEKTGEESQKASEEDKAEPKKPIMIPKYRLDQEVAKRREAEARLEARNKAIEEAKPFTKEAPVVEIENLTESVKSMFDKVLDGDLDAATADFAAMMQSSNQKLIEAVRADTAKQVMAGSQHVTATTDLDTVIDDLESTYDVLNSKSENYDANLVSEVLAMQAGYAASGMSDAQAMDKAAKNALLLYGYAQAESDEPAAAEPKAPAKSRDVERNIKAAAQQPPDLPPSSSDDQTKIEEINVLELSDDEFDALPESVQRRLRGDFGA